MWVDTSEAESVRGVSFSLVKLRCCREQDDHLARVLHHDGALRGTGQCDSTRIARYGDLHFVRHSCLTDGGEATILDRVVGTHRCSPGFLFARSIEHVDGQDQGSVLGGADAEYTHLVRVRAKIFFGDLNGVVDQERSSRDGAIHIQFSAVIPHRVWCIEEGDVEAADTLVASVICETSLQTSTQDFGNGVAGLYVLSHPRYVFGVIVRIGWVVVVSRVLWVIEWATSPHTVLVQGYDVIFDTTEQIGPLYNSDDVVVTSRYFRSPKTRKTN